jgi:hypothetical protein
MKTEYPQEQVIDVLCGISEEFRSFHTRNQTAIDKLKIRWYKYSELSNGFCFLLPDGRCEIDLRIIPPDRDSAFIVAHELYHCMLWLQQGYVNLRPYGKLGRTLNGDLHSAIYDHYIHKRLLLDFPRMAEGCIKFKSIFQQFYDKHLKGKSDVEKEFELRLLFVFVNCWLSFAVLCEADQIEQFLLIDWVKTNKPDIYRQGKELITLIQGCDFDSPSDVNTLVEKVLSNVGISSHFIPYVRST